MAIVDTDDIEKSYQKYYTIMSVFILIYPWLKVGLDITLRLPGVMMFFFIMVGLSFVGVMLLILPRIKKNHVVSRNTIYILLVMIIIELILSWPRIIYSM